MQFCYYWMNRDSGCLPPCCFPLYVCAISANSLSQCGFYSISLIYSRSIIIIESHCGFISSFCQRYCVFRRYSVLCQGRLTKTGPLKRCSLLSLIVEHQTCRPIFADCGWVISDSVMEKREVFQLPSMWSKLSACPVPFSRFQDA